MLFNYKISSLIEKGITLSRISLFAALIFLPSFVYSEKKTLTWRVANWAPFYILEGNKKGSGLYDSLISKMETILPEYKHIRREMSTERVLQEMAHEKRVCHPSVLPNTDAELSKVNSVLLPHRLFVNERVGIELPSQVVSLKSILENSNYKGGVTFGRYTDKLNNVLSDFSDSPYITNYPVYKNLLHMFLKNRFDYILEYPAVVSFSAKKYQNKTNFSSRTIKETASTPYLLVHFACTKNSWGRNIIKKINAELIRESQSDNFLKQRLRWYTGKNKDTLETLYREVYFRDKK